MSERSAPPIRFPLRVHWSLITLWSGVFCLLSGLCIHLAITMPYQAWGAAAAGLVSLFWFRAVLHTAIDRRNDNLVVDSLGNMTLARGTHSVFADCVEATVYGAWLVHLRLMIADRDPADNSRGGRNRKVGLVLLSWTDKEAHRMLRQRLKNDNLASPLTAVAARRQDTDPIKE